MSTSKASTAAAGGSLWASASGCWRVPPHPPKSTDEEWWAVHKDAVTATLGI